MANTDCAVRYHEDDKYTELRIKRPEKEWEVEWHKGGCKLDDGSGVHIEPFPNDEWMFHSGEAYLNQHDGKNPFDKSVDPWNHARTNLCHNKEGAAGYRTQLLGSLAHLDREAARSAKAMDMSTNAFTGTGRPVPRQRTATDSSTAKDNVGA